MYQLFFICCGYKLFRLVKYFLLERTGWQISGIVIGLSTEDSRIGHLYTRHAPCFSSRFITFSMLHLVIAGVKTTSVKIVHENTNVIVSLWSCFWFFASNKHLCHRNGCDSLAFLMKSSEMAFRWLCLCMLLHGKCQNKQKGGV